MQVRRHGILAALSSYLSYFKLFFIILHFIFLYFFDESSLVVMNYCSVTWKLQNEVLSCLHGITVKTSKKILLSLPPIGILEKNN